MSWSEVAADLGFSDQAHLIREFGALAGSTPVEVAARIKQIGHGKVRP
jgi:AraC-like DNA-binding protein